MKRFVLFAVACSVVIAGTACDSIFPPTYQDFVIRIDSVAAPGAVSGGAAFDVRFYGPVGPNGCFRFKEFKMTRTPGSADITVVGEFVSPTSCTQAPVYLDGQPLTFTPPTTDPFMLRVHQPDGTVLPRTIRSE